MTCKELLFLISLLSFLPYTQGDWGLKDMGRSYFGDSKQKGPVDTMDVAYYAPTTKNILCKTNEEKYPSCKKTKKLSILIVDQLPVMATQLGCGKRMFHFLEALVGLGHSVSLAYLRPDKHETIVGF